MRQPHFEHVMEALDNPKQFGLDAAMRKELLGDGGTTYDLMGNVIPRGPKARRCPPGFRTIQQTQARRVRVGVQFGPHGIWPPAARNKRLDRIAKVLRFQSHHQRHRPLRIAGQGPERTKARRPIAPASWNRSATTSRKSFRWPISWASSIGKPESSTKPNRRWKNRPWI